MTCGMSFAREVVQFVEVVVEIGELRVLETLSRRDPKVEIDMRVDPQQEVLQNHRPTGSGLVEGISPAHGYR